MTENHNRCYRLRFSLRTLLVAVAAVGILLGWLISDWRFARERWSWFTRLNAQAAEGGGVCTWAAVQCDGCELPKEPQWREGAYWRLPTIPFWRRWLGDETFSLVKAPDSWSKDDAMKLRSLFPEAFVYWNGDYISSP